MNKEGYVENKYQEGLEEAADNQGLTETRLPKEISAYRIAQKAMVDLKTAVYFMMLIGPTEGYSNADIGRKLGIYTGHVGHEGHISRTILGLLESEGILYQDSESKKWLIRK